MKSLKSIFKIAGAVMAVIGILLGFGGRRDLLPVATRRPADRKARREEMKDYAD